MNLNVIATEINATWEVNTYDHRSSPIIREDFITSSSNTSTLMGFYSLKFNGTPVLTLRQVIFTSFYTHAILIGLYFISESRTELESLGCDGMLWSGRAVGVKEG